MTAQEVVDRVVRELETTGTAKIQKRREKVMQMAAAREHWGGMPARLVSRTDAIFTIDQGRMLAANRRFSLKLLVRANHTADLVFRDDDSAAVLYPRKSKHPLVPALPADGARWSKLPADAQRIRAFIEGCNKALAWGSPELQVQLQLVKLLASRTGPKAKGLANLRAVMPFGFPTEVATVVTLAGAPGTGNIDVLARTNPGGREGGDFVVLELKKPELHPSHVASALHQAIRYATALRIEANELLSTPTDGPRHYHTLFAPTAGGTQTYRKPLVVHAVAVLPSTLAERATKELDQLELSRPVMLPGDGPPLRVGVLLYEATESDSSWKLASGPSAFRWLERGGAWRPTTRRR